MSTVTKEQIQELFLVQLMVLAEEEHHAIQCRRMASVRV